jgi:threonine dehydratase
MATDGIAISLDEIEAAQERLRGVALRTPLVRLNVENAPATIYLKLENLQPIGSFKLRGAFNAMAVATPEQLAAGVYTASAGNMAQGVAWSARRLGIPCTVIVPDHAPATKLAAIERMGGTIIKVPFDVWWNVIITHKYEGMAGLFIHPVSDRAVMAGNGTIGLEILDDLADVDAVVIPYGGGGLSCGIASALRAKKPSVKIYAAEVETAAPLAPSLAAGHPVPTSYTPTFIDGIGGKSVLEEMWPLAKSLLDGSIVVSVAEIAAAVKTLAERNRVIAEGAGAAALAAAMTREAGSGKVVCIVSGGNIDAAKLTTILSGGVP